MPIDALPKAIFDGIKNEIASRSKAHIEILSISSQSDDCQDGHVILELPGAVLMEINCDRSEESDFEYCHDFDSNVANLVSLVSHFVVKNCQFHSFEKVAQLFDDARKNAREEIAKWSEANDAHIHLTDMRLSMNAYWRHTVELPTSAEFSYLDDLLRPSSVTFNSVHPDGIIKELRSIYTQIKERTAALRYFQHAGADGEVDLIAINSLRLNGAVEPQLRRLQNHNLRKVANLSVNCGHIYYRGPNFGSPAMTVDGNRIRIFDTMVPETVLECMPRRPIVDFIQYPLFSSEITILEARNVRGWIEGDFLELIVEQPRLLYCQFTGSYWEK